MKNMKKLTLLTAFFICYTLQSQVGIGIPNPHASAVLELANTHKGFLPPRLTTAQRDAIKQPALGLTIYNTSKKCLEWYLNTGWFNACGDNAPAEIDNFICNTAESGIMEEGLAVINVTQTITVNVRIVGSYTISASANGVTFSAYGNFTSTGNHDIVLNATGIPLKSGNHNFTLNTGPNNCSFSRSVIATVKGKAGKIWMAYNLGSTAPAKSITDNSQYGDYFQWGREADGHQKHNSAKIKKQSTTTSPGHDSLIIDYDNWLKPSNTTLWQGVNGINNPCPEGFRIPTIQEWDAELTASGIKNAVTAFNSVLKLTPSGYRNYKLGTYVNIGTSGYYWSSTVNGNDSKYKLFNTTTSNNNGFRSSTISVRCIKD
jgi:uncharacterized protein (TIGR02145 family)